MAGWTPDTDTAPGGAVVYLSLTSHCAPAAPASSTARPLQFSVAVPSGHHQKIGSSACRRWRSRPRSL